MQELSVAEPLGVKLPLDGHVQPKQKEQERSCKTTHRRVYESGPGRNINHSH